MPDGLKIVKATYGIQGNFTDVTKEVQAMVDDGSINFVVSPQNLGILDPAPGVSKTFQAQVVINKGTPTIMSKNDGEVFVINATPDPSKKSGPAASQAYFMGSIFKNIGVALLWFFTVFGMYASFHLAKAMFGSDVFGYIFGIFSIAGYTILLHILFFWRLFRGEDFNLTLPAM